jgi:hypothetical protein
VTCSPTCKIPTPAQAHCSVCHRTFGGVYGFDRHRHDGRCLDPAGLHMILRDGVWRAEMTDRKRAQLDALRGAA